MPEFDPLKLSPAPEEPAQSVVPSAQPVFDPKALAGTKGGPPAVEEEGRPYLSRIADIPGDIQEQATQGLSAVYNAPSKITGTAKNHYEENIPKWIEMGMPEDKAKEMARKLQVGEGALDVPMGLMQAFISPIMGPARSMGSRPLEESTGFPKEGSELLAGIAMGRPRVTRAAARQGRTPVSDTLRESSNESYTVARSLPIQFLPQTTVDIASNIERALGAPGLAYNSNVAKGTWREINSLREPDNFYPTVGDIDGVRTRLGYIARKVDAHGHRTPDAGAAAHAIEFLDNQMVGLTPQHAMSGGHLIPTLNQTLARARGDYAAYMRADIVEQALEKATRGAGVSGAGANVENKIRQAFNGILNNRKLAQRYTQQELAMMEEVALGDQGRNAARYVGKFAPTGSVSTGMVSMIGRLLGGESGARALTGTLMGAGWASKKIADSAARTSAERTIDAIRQRSPYYLNQNVAPHGRGFRMGTKATTGALQPFRINEETE